MKVSINLVEFVKRWEGLRLDCYADTAGVPTCGYGHAWPFGPFPWTLDRAEAQLEADLEEHGGELLHYLDRDPTQQQFDALTSLAFNCGVAAIGSSGVVRLYNKGDMKACADRFLLWNKAGGYVSDGLMKRRKAERAMFLDGDYTGAP